MIIYTFPVKLDRKIIAPSQSINIPDGGKLSTIEIDEAVNVNDAEIIAPDSLMTLRTIDGREFERVRGTIQENRRGNLPPDEATIIFAWQRKA